MAELDYLERRLETISTRLHNAWNEIFAHGNNIKTNTDILTDLEKRVRDLEADDLKAKGAVAALGFVGAAGGTALVEYIVRHFI